MSSENCAERRLPQESSVMFVVYLPGEDKFVIEERTREDSAYKGFFMIPAGHVEKGEKPEETLVREMTEEQGIVPLDYYHLDTFENVSLNGSFFLVDAFLVGSYSGELINKEPHKCNLHKMDFNEAMQKMLLVQNRYVLLLAQQLLGKYC